MNAEEGAGWPVEMKMFARGGGGDARGEVIKHEQKTDVSMCHGKKSFNRK